MMFISTQSNSDHIIKTVTHARVVQHYCWIRYCLHITALFKSKQMTEFLLTLSVTALKYSLFTPGNRGKA